MPQRQPSNWIALAALVIALFGNVAIYTSRSAHDYRSCKEREAQKTYTRGAINRAQAQLPTIDYYREHQDELKTSLRNLEEQESTFAAKECHRQWFPW